MQRNFLLALIALAAVALTGCGTNKLPLNYAPTSVLTASGEARVDQFDYAPARGGKIKSNQIRNTAIGNLYFEQDIAVIFKDAVFKELRFVGVKMDAGNATISGEIEEFLIDDLGYSVDWTLRVRYQVKDASGAVVYESVKNIQRNTNKFANVFGALNETIKLNIEEIIKDPAFLKTIQ
jgi:uncharacterized lipoprotein